MSLASFCGHNNEAKYIPLMLAKARGLSPRTDGQPMVKLLQSTG